MNIKSERQTEYKRSETAADAYNVAKHSGPKATDYKPITTVGGSKNR